MAAKILACPHCQSTLKSSHAVPAGERMTCPHCGAQFTVPVGLVKPALSKYPIARPYLPPQAVPNGTPELVKKAPRGWIVSLVIAGFLVLLACGVVLVVYCFTPGQQVKDNQLSLAPAPANPAPAEPAPSEPTPASAPAQPAPAAPTRQQRAAAAPKPSLTALPEKKQKTVNAAIDRGVAFLKSNQAADGRWPEISDHVVGPVALPALTLLECGVPASDSAVQKAATFIRHASGNLDGTYDLALAILFLDKLGDVKDSELIQQFALRLIAGQNAQGGWTYECPVLHPKDQGYLLTVLKKMEAHYSVHSIPGNDKLQRDKPWRPKPEDVPEILKHAASLQKDPANNSPLPAVGVRDDNSNTQFALIALWTARRHHFPVDRSLALVARRFRGSQKKDGYWGYDYAGDKQVSEWPTMTCSGLLGLAVGHGLADAAPRQRSKIAEKSAAPRPSQDPAVQKALKWLGHSVGVPMGDQLDLYYFWSLERVAVMYNLKKIGHTEWYPWGVDLLLAHQQANGSWDGEFPGHTPVIGTCFALLFLKRANLAKDLTKQLELLEIQKPHPADKLKAK